MAESNPSTALAATTPYALYAPAAHPLEVQLTLGEAKRGNPEPQRRLQERQATHEAFVARHLALNNALRSHYDLSRLPGDFRCYCTECKEWRTELQAMMAQATGHADPRQEETR